MEARERLAPRKRTGNKVEKFLLVNAEYKKNVLVKTKRVSSLMSIELRMA